MSCPQAVRRFHHAAFQLTCLEKNSDFIWDFSILEDSQKMEIKEGHDVEGDFFLSFAGLLINQYDCAKWCVTWWLLLLWFYNDTALGNVDNDNDNFAEKTEEDDDAGAVR